MAAMASDRKRDFSETKAPSLSALAKRKIVEIPPHCGILLPYTHA